MHDPITRYGPLTGEEVATIIERTEKLSLGKCYDLARSWVYLPVTAHLEAALQANRKEYWDNTFKDAIAAAENVFSAKVNYDLRPSDIERIEPTPLPLIYAVRDAALATLTHDLTITYIDSQNPHTRLYDYHIKYLLQPWNEVIGPS